MAVGQSCRGGERRLRGVAVDQVHEAERRVIAICREHVGRGATRVRNESDAPRLLTEPLQQSRPSLADDAVGRLDDRVEDAVDAPALAADRR